MTGIMARTSSVSPEYCWYSPMCSTHTSGPAGITQLELPKVHRIGDLH